jgi:hypothetical protein
MTKKTTALSERWLPFMHPNFRLAQGFTRNLTLMWLLLALTPCSGVQGYLEVSLEVMPQGEMPLILNFVK